MDLILLMCFCFTIAHAEKCSDICGDAIEYINGVPDPNYHKPKVRTSSEPMDKRIVNGYSVKDRGFLTLIRAYYPENEELYESCGGTLINDLYILTAGHCVCNQQSSTNVPCDLYGELQYDPKEVIKAYIGLNDKNVTDLEKRHDVSRFVHRIDKVIIHEGWDGSQLPDSYPDLALVKLAERVHLTDDIWATLSIQPACLPKKGVNFEGIGYAAGWGQIRNDACMTDNNGPNRHEQCRFPFIYENKLKHSCQLTTSPSTKNKRCQQFKLDKGLKAMPQKGQSLMILYNRQKRATKCYYEGKHYVKGQEKQAAQEGYYGWCGVCKKNAKMWEYGYCPEFGLTQENDTDTGIITRAKRAKDWGFCSPLCDSQSLSQHLMETKLDILTPEECNKFNSATLFYRDDAEICAGNKIMYPTIKVYIRKKLRKPRNGKKYVFIYSEDRKNTVRPSLSF